MSQKMVPVRALSELITKGTTPTSIGRKFVASGVRFLKVETFAADGSYVPDKEAHIDEETHRLLRRSQLAEGDILFSIAGALGRTTIVEPGWLPANTNQALAIIRPSNKSGVIHPRYLLWSLRSPTISSRINEINVQAAQANLSLQQVGEFEIPLLSMAEQKAIIKALDDVDALVASIHQLIAKKRDIKQGMMQELLMGHTRLPGFTGDWNRESLGDVLAYRQPTQYLVESAGYVESGTPVLTAGKSFVLGYTTETQGVYIDLPVVIFDDFTTDSKYVAFPFKAKSSAMKMLTPRAGVDLRWAYERMQIVDFVAVDHKRRWISEFSKIEIEVPSLNEQEAIAAVSSDADAEIDALEQRLESAKAVKVGMMQKLLTGHTRLPVEEEP